jgi:hypothetical protein
MEKSRIIVALTENVGLISSHILKTRDVELCTGYGTIVNGGREVLLLSEVW